MREQAKKVEVQKFSPDLVEDFCNLAAGGKILPPSEWREYVRSRSHKKLPKPDSDGEWRLLNGNYTSNRHKAISDQLERGMRYQQAVCDFLQTIKLDKTPGSSPLEQAMNLLKLLATQRGGESDEDGETLPIFERGDSEKTGVRFNKILDQIESLTNEEQELLNTEKDTDSEKNERGDDSLSKMRLAEDMARGRDIWLKVSRQLDKLVRMKVARSVKVQPDPEGKDVRVRPITHFGEIGQLQKSEWALPSVYRTFRVVNKSALVRERVSHEEKQQLLYMIIDCSGSMSDGQRIAKAGGVLMNRLKAVITGDAQMFVRFFDSECYEEHFVSTPTEAKEMIRHFEKYNFSGRSTNISGCVKEAQARIEKIVTEKKVTRPELVVVSDGDDYITITTKDLCGTKLHALLVEETNTRLIELARETGGVGIGNL